jgi:hypothetical protein
MKKKNFTKTLKDKNVKISKELRDIIHGYIMSDGYVNNSGILTVDQSKQQEKFVEWLYEKLKDVRTNSPIQKVYRTRLNLAKPSLDVSAKQKQNQKKSYSLRFSTKTFLVGFHRMWYKPYINEKGVTVFKKTLPKRIDGFFNTTFLALWFAGDGTKIKGSIGAKFEVTAFSPDERKTLQKLFKEKFDIEVKINKAGISRANNQQWTLNINASEYQRFRTLITEMDLIERYFPQKLHPISSVSYTHLTLPTN